MFTASAHPQTEPGLVEHEPNHNHRNKYDISGCVVGEHVLHKGAERGARIKRVVEQQGNFCAGGQRNGIGRFEQRLANHNCHARCQHIDCRAGNRLVRTQLHRCQCMECAKQCAGQTAAQKSNPRIVGIVCHNASGECAGRHHTLNADVDHAGNLRKTGAQCGKQQRRHKQEGRINNDAEFINESIHYFVSSFCALESLGFFFRFLM